MHRVLASQRRGQKGGHPLRGVEWEGVEASEQGWTSLPGAHLAAGGLPAPPPGPSDRLRGSRCLSYLVTGTLRLSE